MWSGGLRNPTAREYLMPPYIVEEAPSVGWQQLPRMAAAEPEMKKQKKLSSDSALKDQLSI